MKFDLMQFILEQIEKNVAEHPGLQTECEELDHLGNYGEAHEYAVENDLECFTFAESVFHTAETIHPENDLPRAENEEEIISEQERNKTKGGHEKTRYETTTVSNTIKMDGWGGATYDATGESGYIIGDYMLRQEENEENEENEEDVEEILSEQGVGLSAGVKGSSIDCDPRLNEPQCDSARGLFCPEGKVCNEKCSECVDPDHPSLQGRVERSHILERGDLKYSVVKTDTGTNTYLFFDNIEDAQKHYFGCTPARQQEQDRIQDKNLKENLQIMYTLLFGCTKYPAWMAEEKRIPIFSRLKDLWAGRTTPQDIKSFKDLEGITVSSIQSHDGLSEAEFLLIMYDMIATTLETKEMIPPVVGQWRPTSSKDWNNFFRVLLYNIANKYVVSYLKNRTTGKFQVLKGTVLYDSMHESWSKAGWSPFKEVEESLDKGGSENLRRMDNKHFQEHQIVKQWFHTSGPKKGEPKEKFLRTIKIDGTDVDIFDVNETRGIAKSPLDFFAAGLITELDPRGKQITDPENKEDVVHTPHGGKTLSSMRLSARTETDTENMIKIREALNKKWHAIVLRHDDGHENLFRSYNEAAKASGLPPTGDIDDIFTVMSNIIGLRPPMTTSSGGGLMTSCESMDVKVNVHMGGGRAALQCFTPNTPAYAINTSASQKIVSDMEHAVEMIAEFIIIGGLTGPVGKGGDIFRGISGMGAMGQKLQVWKFGLPIYFGAGKTSKELYHYRKAIEKLDDAEKTYRTAQRAFSNRGKVRSAKYEKEFFARQSAAEDAARSLQVAERAYVAAGEELYAVTAAGARGAAPSVPAGELVGFALRARSRNITKKLTAVHHLIGRHNKLKTVIEELSRINVIYLLWQGLTGGYRARWINWEKTSKLIAKMNNPQSSYRYLKDGVVMEQMFARYFLHRPLIYRHMTKILKWGVLGRGMIAPLGAGGKVTKMSARGQRAMKAWAALAGIGMVINATENPQLARVLIFPEVINKIKTLQETEGEILFEPKHAETREMFKIYLTNQYGKWPTTHDYKLKESPPTPKLLEKIGIGMSDLIVNGLKGMQEELPRMWMDVVVDWVEWIDGPQGVEQLKYVIEVNKRAAQDVHRATKEKKKVVRDRKAGLDAEMRMTPQH